MGTIGAGIMGLKLGLKLGGQLGHDQRRIDRLLCTNELCAAGAGLGATVSATSTAAASPASSADYRSRWRGVCIRHRSVPSGQVFSGISALSWNSAQEKAQARSSRTARTHTRHQEAGATGQERGLHTSGN